MTSTSIATPARHETAASLLDSAHNALASRDVAEAIRLLRHAQGNGADPDRCSAGLWTAHMLSGDFEAAWRESDCIRARGKPDPHRFWQGESLVGKRIMLRCLHGLGDAVQFLRYVPRLRATAAHLTVEVPPRLLHLARCFDGVHDVITWGAQAPAQPPPWNVQIEIMELPWIFRTHLRDLPIATRYLRLPQTSATRGSHRTLRIGLVWTAGSWNPWRSISFDLLAPLLDTSGCEFWNLQSSHHTADDHPLTITSMHTSTECGETIEGLARTIADLDLVITVDTLAAHLAGALGVSTWLMLQHEADWRWMHLRSDSPWYPSLRLFRQPSPGDWASVIASIQVALHSVVQNATSNEAISA